MRSTLAVLVPLFATAAVSAQPVSQQPAVPQQPGVSAVAGADAGADAAAVTFREHIAPILFHNCTSCHRPGEGAPFPLQNYKQVRRKAKMIARVTKSRIMPPWHPVEGHGKFEGELRLTDEQIGLIQKWVATGTEEGTGKLPPIPKFAKG